MLSRREGLSDIKEMPDHSEQGGYFGAAARKKVVGSIRPGWKSPWSYEEAGSQGEAVLGTIYSGRLLYSSFRR